MRPSMHRAARSETAIAYHPRLRVQLDGLRDGNRLVVFQLVPSLEQRSRNSMQSGEDAGSSQCPTFQVIVEPWHVCLGILLGGDRLGRRRLARDTAVYLRIEQMNEAAGRYRRVPHVDAEGVLGYLLLD